MHFKKYFITFHSCQRIFHPVVLVMTKDLLVNGSRMAALTQYQLLIKQRKLPKTMQMMMKTQRMKMMFKWWLVISRLLTSKFCQFHCLSFAEYLTFICLIVWQQIFFLCNNIKLYYSDRMQELMSINNVHHETFNTAYNICKKRTDHQESHCR